MKLLITGFDPFGGEKVNPAFEAVKLLDNKIKGVDIIKLEIPTVFGKAGEKLEEGIKEHSPDFVLCIGQAGGRHNMTIEKVAINLKDARIPDNEGNQPIDEKIKKDGEIAYFSSLPVKSIVKKINEAGIPAALSFTAGTYVCNDIMYTLLYLIDKKFPNIKGGFIHVPFATEQAVGKGGIVPSMSLDNISKALHIAIETTIEGKEEHIGMGNTH